MSALLNVFKTPDLLKKIGFSIFILVIYRFGVQIPVPGVDLQQLEGLRGTSPEAGGIFSYLALFTGGLSLSLFSLGILPYITASIIIQVLTVAVPKLAEWQAQGSPGQRKINQLTRYIAIILGLVQSTGFVYLFRNNSGSIFGVDANNEPLVQLFQRDSPIPLVLLAIFCMTVGTAIVMWLGELATQKGVGNGMSLIIFASVVASIPSIGNQILTVRSWPWLIFAFVILVLLCAGIVYIEQGQRKIPVNFAKRVVGRKQYGGNNSFIPLKVNQAGVIPVIFASSLLQLPTLLVNVLPTDQDRIAEGNPIFWDRVREEIQQHLYSPTSVIYIAVFGLLIVSFTYFYNSIAFDPIQRAEELNRSGGFIPGVRPGPQTETYLSKILNRITLPGSIFLAAVALIPSALLAMLVSNGDAANSGSSGLLGFGGVSILIAVGVSLEIMKQINSQLMARNYEGFLK